MGTTQQGMVGELQRAVAELRRERDEREAERDAALAREAAMAEVLGVINANPGNPAPVFQTLLDRALQLCGAALGELGTYVDGVYTTVAVSGVPADFSELRVNAQARPAPGTIAWRIMHGGNTVQFADLTDTDAYREGNRWRRGLVDVAGARAVVAVALRKGATLLGSIAIYRREPGLFSGRQIALLENFAAQAVIAMENARLLGELRDRTAELAERNLAFAERIDHQAATIDVLKAMSASPGDPQPVFELIAQRAAEVCQVPNAVLFRYEDGLLHWRASSGTEAYASDAALEALKAQFPMPPRNTSLVGRALLEQRTIHIPNLDTERDLYPALRGIDMKSFLSVPLLRDDEPLGVIGLSAKESGGYSQSQVELLQAFAEQAVIAITSAETYRALQVRTAELEESLERQTATAEVLQVINASPGELNPVFDAMLERALRLCGAAFGILYTFDGEQFHMGAARGVPAAFEAYRRQHPMRVRPDVPPGQAILTRRPVQVEDVMTHPFFVANPELQDIQVRLGGIRAVLNLPLVKDETPCGMFVIYRAEPGAFPERQIALLQEFGAQAVIAMDNARLLNEIRQRQSELDITFENMGDGVAMFDAEQKLAAWNRNFQDILDLPDDAVRVGLPFADYIRDLTAKGEYGPDADADEQIARLNALLGQANRFERTRPNGHIIDIRQNPIPGGGFVIIYADITERKRAEEALRAARDAAEQALRELKVAQAGLVQAEKMASLGQLTAGIAHEIKNPLNFVNNFAGLSVELLNELKETAAPAFATLDEATRADVNDLATTLTSNLEKIGEHGRRADGIVRSMLEHSRGSSGERRDVDLNTLVEEALNLAYHGARAQDQSFNITLERDFGEGIAPITLTPQDMMRVLLNLFSNGFYAARKRQASERNGFEPTLRVSTRDDSNAVEIRVRDNGTGIPAEIRDKLFQPFFTTKPTGEGTGLGLSITYDIVTKQHGGAIVVDSEPGSFTEFTVTLPRRTLATEGAQR